MSRLDISLFGKFSLSIAGREVPFSRSQNVLELLCYLLIFHDRPHHREKLADLIWCDFEGGKPKQYLRKTLYMLKEALSAIPDLNASELLIIEPEWLQINIGTDIWLDVAEFERVFNSVCDLHGYDLEESSFTALQEAVCLYKGDLLEGWYQDWCNFERDRYREMLFTILSEMIDYCELTNRDSLGIMYCNQILRYEHANERIHRCLMRLYYSAGDRTTALKQYDRLKATLDEELGVKPSRRTSELHQQIVSNQHGGISTVSIGRGEINNLLGSQVQDSLDRIRKLISEQASGQRNLLKEIQDLIKAVKSRS